MKSTYEWTDVELDNLGILVLLKTKGLISISEVLNTFKQYDTNKTDNQIRYRVNKLSKTSASIDADSIETLKSAFPKADDKIINEYKIRVFNKDVNEKTESESDIEVIEPNTESRSFLLNAAILTLAIMSVVTFIMVIL